MSDDEDGKWIADMDRLLNANAANSPKPEVRTPRRTIKPIGDQDMEGERNMDRDNETGSGVRKSFGPPPKPSAGIGRGRFPVTGKPTSSDKFFSSMFGDKTQKTDNPLPAKPESSITPKTESPLHTRTRAAANPRQTESSGGDWLGIGNTDEPRTTKPISRFPANRRPINSENSDENSGERRPVTAAPSRVPVVEDTERGVTVGRELMRRWNADESGGNAAPEPEVPAAQRPMRPMPRVISNVADTASTGVPVNPSRDRDRDAADHKPASTGLVQLPFLQKPTETKPAIIAPPEPEPAYAEASVAYPGPGDAEVGQPTTGSGVKKKVVMVRKQVPISESASSKATLQLPSHLVDEAELKNMSLSLKALYGNQMEMFQGSYQEQMECLVQSCTRREEMLKEEIKMIHADYEMRLDRLKNEVAEVEKRYQNQGDTNLKVFAEQIKTFETQTNELLSIQRQQSQSLPSPEKMSGMVADLISKEMGKVISACMSGFMTNLESLITTKLRDSTANLQGTNDGAQNQLIQKFDQISSKLDNLVKARKEDFKGSEIRLTETEKKIEDELVKLTKEQKKIQDVLLKGTVNTLTQSLKTSSDGKKKKDKLERQLKEFRREFRVLMADVEKNQENMQNTHVALETEQKNLSKNIQDVHSWLQTNWTKSNSSTKNHSNSHSHKLNQAEMNEALAKQHKNSLAEAKADLRQKSFELDLEKQDLLSQKQSLEEEKQRLQHFQAAAQVEMARAEQMKKEAEASQLDNLQLVSNYSRKLQDIERDSVLQKDALEKIKIRAQKLVHDETDIRREKELFDKVRTQALCPDCLKLISPLPIGAPQFARSDGDGLEVSDYKMSTATDRYIDAESQLVKKMISEYYGPQIFKL